MKGGVLFEIRTAFFEPLASGAVKKGIGLYDIKRTGRSRTTCRVPDGQEKAFQAYLSGYAIEARVIGRRGRSAGARFAKAHPALLLLSAALLFAVFALSERIWVIEAPDGALASALESVGVYRGIRRDKIDTAAVSRQLLAAFPEYAFVRVNAMGVTLTVEAKTAYETPETYKRDDARNLVSAFDGIVESVNVTAGKALVKPGDAVKKGDILILGEERLSKSGDTRPVRAAGSVKARVWTQAESTVYLLRPVKKYTGREARAAYLKTPFFTKLLYEEGGFALADVERQSVPLVGLYLPAAVERETRLEYIRETEIVPAAQAELAASEKALIKARALAPADAEYRAQWIKITQSETAVRAEAVAEWILEISY